MWIQLRVVFTNGEIRTETLSYGRRLNDKPSDYFAFRRIDNISSIMKSPTEIHSNSAIELQVYHLMTCYHNFCIMSPLSRQQSFPLQVKRICRDSSFVTLMSFSAKLSLPARFFSHCFGSHGRTLNYFCNRLLAARRYVTWLVSNHDRSNHDRRIMSENPGVYIAMKSAVNVFKENIPSQKKNDVKINCMQWKLFSFTRLQNQGGVQRILSDYMKRALF